MTWTELLTRIEGRISRKPFWIALLALLTFEVAANIAFGDRWSSIVSILLAYPEFAVLAKRGHDRNVSALAPALFIVTATALDVLALLDVVGPTDNPNTLFYIVGVPAGIVGLILLVDFGFRRGTVGANRYGPDPLALQ